MMQSNNLEFQNTEGTRPAWASKCDDRTVTGVPYVGSSPSGVGGLPLRREMTCILLTVTRLSEHYGSEKEFDAL